MAKSCDRIVRGLRRRGVLVDVLHFMPQPRGRPWAIETQAGGRYLACPIEDDPAHALNRAWSALQAAAGSRSRTSSRSAARGRSWPARCSPPGSACR